MSKLRINIEIAVVMGNVRQVIGHVPFEVSIADPSNDPSLSPRLRQVLEGIRRGKLNKEIADELNIGVRTVKFHVSELLLRYKVTSRRDLFELPKVFVD